MHKFTLPAGTTNRHQWHKEAAKAVEGVTRTFNQMRELWGTKGGDERESLVSVFSFGADDPKNPEAVEIYEALGERFGWQITRDNAADVAGAFREALPRCVESIPVEDNRTTPEQNAERDELRRTQEAERKAEADAKRDRVEAIAEELRKQYPDAEPKGSKSEHARASANLKRLLQARGFRVSVKSSSFSMGDSVRANVLTPDIDPDTRKEFDELAERFSYSTFDPMTDSSGYKRDDESEAWRLVHGSTKYCRIEWEQSDECREACHEFAGPDGSGHQVWSGAHCLASEFWAKWTEDHATPEPEPGAQGGSGYEIEQHTHTKKGFTFWLVVLADRVERDEFNRLRSSCKAAGGWYSRKWGNTPCGFAFKEQERAGAWAIEQFRDNEPPPPAPTKPRGTSKKRGAMAGRFRDMAEKLDAEVTAKRSPRQENTPKRQREAMSRRIDADRLERTAQGLRALADLHEAGKVPEILQGVKSKKRVYEILGTRTESQGYYHIGDTGEPTDTSPYGVALWGLIQGKDPEQEKADKLAEMLAGLPKIPGYFPTPPEVIERMLDYAQIEPGHTVLEPSAGSGSILDALPETLVTVCCESNPTLCEILQAKGYDARPNDFLAHDGSFKFDRIVMNPPFENLQDVAHVQHAFTKLKDGGRLVAIMSPGPFFRSDKKCEAFRYWFESFGGEVHDIEAGAFKESGTGVASKLVVIDKAEAVQDEKPKPKAAPQVAPLAGMTPLGLKPHSEEPEQMAMF